jgi:hypothetical protein
MALFSAWFLCAIPDAASLLAGLSPGKTMTKLRGAIAQIKTALPFIKPPMQWKILNHIACLSPFVLTTVRPYPRISP